MIGPVNRWVPAVTTVVCLCSIGCSSITMTAANSINPVMFGPVRTLGAQMASGETSRAKAGTVFLHSETVSASGGPYFGGRESWSTNAFGDEEKEFDLSTRNGWKENLCWLDWKVVRATGEDSTRRVEVTSLRCGGFDFFVLFGLFYETSCEMEAVALDLPR